MTSIPMTTEYVDVKVKIGAVEFTNEELQIDSIKISNGCYDGSVFGIGNVYIKNANITMNYRDGITKGLSMEIFFEYQGAWISFGKFVVTETPVMSGDKLSVSLESEFGQTVSTSVDFTSTLQEYTLRDIKTKIEEITGKPIIFVPELTTDEEKSFLEKTACFLKNISDYVNQSGIKTGISVRDMLSGIAILFGGNVYEDTNNKIIIKQKTYYKNSNIYVSSDYLDSNYKYSQEIYAVRLVTLTFLPWCLGLYNPPNASGRICTVNYLGEDKVSNTLLASQSSMDGKTPYDYTIDCDWVGWTSDGSTFDTNVTPGGRASACLRQGDLMYRTCDMTFVGIDFGWNIAPGNLIKVKVPELENPIDVLCGEISYEWDGGFTTNISCNCNIESNGSYSTQVSTQASAVAEKEGRQTSLDLNYANITFSNIEDSTIRGSIFKDGTIDGSKIKDSTITGSLIADSTIKGSNIEEGTITGSLIKAATITGALIVDGTIRGNHIMESSIDGSKIEDSAITESKISNSSITNSKIKDGEIENSKIKDATLTGSKIENSTLTNDLFKDGTIENSKIKDATLTGAKIQDATIGFAKVDTSFIKDLTADKAYIENLKSSIADIGYLTADEADIAYAKIDFSNVGTQVVGSSMIIDGAVTNEKVANLSANKITSGTIDASKITVTNLNADNITVGTINGQRIGNGSLSLDKLAEEVPTKEYLDNVQKELQGQIDGAIETFTKSEIPTLNNEPANAWTDNETRKKHIGDVCYVLNPASSADGYCYRFANTGTDASPKYEWVLIKDSDVTKALQDIIDINGEITGIKQFDTEISSWKTDTDTELSSLKSRTATLETDIGSKVESSVFNELKQTVDENSSNITSLSTTVSKKADSSTVTALTNTVNSVKQTADKNTSSISSMQTEIGKKADGSTVTELSQRTSNIEQNLDGFKTEVSKTYATNTALNTVGADVQEVYNKMTTNLLNPTKETTTQNGLTFTNNGDGTYTLNGTATNNTDLVIFNETVNFKNVKLLGCPKGGSKTTYRLFMFWDNILGNNVIDYGDGSNTISIDNVNLKVNISTFKGVTYNNVVFKPMITTNLNATYDDFVPYTGDSGSLNGDLANNHKLTEIAKTIAEQTADKFSWIVKSGTSETDFTLTDRVASLLSEQFNIDALTTFKNSAENGTSTVINGGSIKAKTIKADSIDVRNLFAQDITADGIIRGATLVGASISANKGTIGGFGIFDNWLAGSYEENGYQYQVEINTDKSYTDANGRTYAIYANKSKKDPLNIENEWYVTYDGYMHAEVGEIAGFTLKDQTLVSEFTQTDISNSVWDFKNEINSKANSEKHFITATRTGHESGLIANKACFGIDGVFLNSFNHADDYYDKWMNLGIRGLALGVNSATPYNGSSIAFEIDSGYSAITSSGEFGIEPSCTINVPTTIRNALRVESDPSDAENSYVRINNHEVQLHAINSSVVFYLSAYGGSNNKFKLYSTNGNIVDVTDTTAMTITPKITASNGITEQGYGVVGCTVTKSGNFTCKKYRDGRLIIEFRFKTTSNVSLSNKAETYYATGPAATFPIAFTDVPAVVSGLGISNLNAPFCNVTFESVTKTGFGRYIIWTLPTISGYVIPSSSVVSATFTGRWK